MLKSFRYFLFPLSILYGAIIALRNWLFDKNIISSAHFNFPIICVGNLALGGTGKTPMVAYVVNRLKKNYKTAVISRGYKRKTKGFGLAVPTSTAIDIGDEPMQLFRKFPEITVAVGEERIVAVPQLLQEKPDTQVIVLDDAFQHRSIHAGLNILLTEHGNLFSRDHLFPAGDLRDEKKSSRRAHIIVVTKCPEDISEQDCLTMEAEVKKDNNQHVFFTCLEYGNPYGLQNGDIKELSQDMDILLVCGIANPEPLKQYINTHVKGYEMIRYRDHHIFRSMDLNEIKNQFDRNQSSKKIILTTEKDAIRLEKFKSELDTYPVYVLPVEHKFLYQQSEVFEKLLIDYVNSYYDKKN